MSNVSHSTVVRQRVASWQIGSKLSRSNDSHELEDNREVIASREKNRFDSLERVAACYNGALFVRANIIQNAQFTWTRFAKVLITRHVIRTR